MGSGKPRSEKVPKGSSAASTSPAKVAGDEQVAPQLRVQGLDPGGEVDGRPDGGEVEPVAGADIAVADFAQVQGHAAAGRRRQVQRRHRPRRGLGRPQCRGADSTWLTLGQRENRQEPVADQLEHLAAFGLDRGHDAAEHRVQPPITCSGGCALLKAVKPRMSETRIAASMRWTSPGRMAPLSTRSPEPWPT